MAGGWSRRSKSPAVPMGPTGELPALCRQGCRAALARRLCIDRGHRLRSSIPKPATKRRAACCGSSDVRGDDSALQERGASVRRLHCKCVIRIRTGPVFRTPGAESSVPVAGEHARPPYSALPRAGHHAQGSRNAPDLVAITRIRRGDGMSAQPQTGGSECGDGLAVDSLEFGRAHNSSAVLKGDQPTRRLQSRTRTFSRWP